MTRKKSSIDPNPLAPARSQAEWEAQGWSTEPEPLNAASRLETTVSIRFDPESAKLLRQAARLSGLTRSEFIRRATVIAAQEKVAETPTPVSFRRVSPSPKSVTTSSAVPLEDQTSAAPRTLTRRTA